MDEETPDDITTPGIGAELEGVAAMLRGLWRELRQDEEQMRAFIAKANSGAELDTKVLAAQMRGMGGCLSDRSVRLHDAARRFEAMPRPGGGSS